MATSNSLNIPYDTDSVTSRDGTTIGYRRLGTGPGVVLLHGSMMSSKNLMKLAASMSDTFTVFVPDRRGRGRSGGYAADHCIRHEVDDVRALLRRAGASNLFGLSAGAIIALQAALIVPEVTKLAVYEPPLALDEGLSTGWVPQYEEELGRGELAAAMATIMLGTGDARLLRFVPRPLLVGLMALAIKAEAKQAKDDDVPLRDLIPTMHYESRVVFDTAGPAAQFAGIGAEVLLLGGERSASYLRTALDALAVALPHARRVELPGVGHLAADNGGKPRLVADELRRFFAS